MDIHFRKQGKKHSKGQDIESIALDNGIIRLEFDKLTGNLVQLIDVGLWKKLLRDPRGNRLLKLVCSTTEIGSLAICSHESDQPRINQRDDRLEFFYPQLLENGNQTDISAKVTIRLPPSSWEATFTLELQNNGPILIHEVHFPWIGGWSGFAGPGVDQITVSTTRLAPYEAFPTMRAHSFKRHHMRRFIGSEFKQAPLFDISGGGTGISYNLYTRVPRYAGLVIEDLSPDYQQTCLSWAWVSYPFLGSGDRWVSPEVGMGVHRGDWHETADRLRRSMQKWWLPPSTPQRLRESMAIHHIQFTGHDGEFYHNFSEIPAIASDCMRYGVNDLCVWDQQAQLYVRHKEDNGWWDYSPEKKEALIQGVADARKLGCHVTAWLDYMYFTERSSLFGEFKDEVLRSFYGKPLTQPYSRIGMEHANYLDETLEKGAHILCDCSPKFQQVAYELTKQTLSFGFEGIFIDGATAWRLCHAKNHEHQSPDDTLEGCVRWIAEVSRMVKEHYPQGYLIGEGVDSFNNQTLDMYMSWWQPGDHTEVLQYVWPEILLSWGVDQNDRDVIPEIFIKNQILSTMTSNLDGCLSEHPEFAMHVARLARLRQDTKEFIAYGSFQDNKGLSIEGGIGHTYISEKGLAVAIGNPSLQGSRIRIQFSPEALGYEPNLEGLLYVEGIKPARIIADEKDGTLEMDLVLPAYGSGVWCLPKSEG